MRATTVLCTLILVGQTSALLAQWESTDQWATGDQSPTSSWLLDVSYLDHRGGPLTDAYSDGVGTHLGWNGLISPWDMNSNVFWCGGFEYQNWNSERFNANAPGNNFGPDGNASLYGGFIGVGLEESAPYQSACLGPIEMFVFLRSNLGVGGMHQGFQQQPFDATLPIFVVDDATPQSSSAYVSGLFSAGVGVNNDYSSLGFVLSYQLMRSSIITDRSSNTGSILYGLQGTLVLDGLYRRPPVQPQLGRVPYINRMFQNSGVGRETRSLQRMVTPRIIIQEDGE